MDDDDAAGIPRSDDEDDEMGQTTALDSPRFVTNFSAKSV